MKLKNKIVLGTMKLRKYFKNSKELSIFLEYAHNNGIRQLHVSNEYNSYKLLIKSLIKIKTKKFTLILKLPEPNKDSLQFSLKRFRKKIDKYRKDLGGKHNYIIQLVNRNNCNNYKRYLLNERKTLDTIKNFIIKLKKMKYISEFYFFPYFKNKNKTKIKKSNFIDGITIYRNINTNSDRYAKQNKFKIIAMRIFGGNKKILNKKNFKKLVMFNLRNKLVSKVIIGANNKAQLDKLLEVC